MVKKKRKSSGNKRKRNGEKPQLGETVERNFRRGQVQGDIDPAAIFASTHDFIKHVTFEPHHYGWVDDASTK